MKCPNCGAENMDGAQGCYACGQSLIANDPAAQKSANATWWALGVGAVLIVAVVGLTLASGGSGGGGGGGGGGLPAGSAGASGTAGAGGQAGAGAASVGTAPGSDVTTRQPTPEQKARVLAEAKSRIAKDYPEFAKVTPNVVAYSYAGAAFVDAVYETEISVQGSKGTLQIPHSVIVSLDEASGQVTVYAQD